MRRARKWLFLSLLLAFFGFVFFLWHPVCVPIADDEARNFQGRSGDAMWGVHTFQNKNGHLYQCKPWLARQMFF
jgi:hypothetical protein